MLFSFPRTDGDSLLTPVFVTNLLAGGPALTTGKIMLRDELVAVDGTEVYNKTMDYIHDLIWYALRPAQHVATALRERSNAGNHLTGLSFGWPPGPCCSGPVGSIVILRIRRGRETFLVSVVRRQAK
jgi:hypothetical protein